MIFTFQSFEQGAPVAANVAVVYILLLNSFAYEDKNKSEIMLNSLPISRSDIVLAKYLSILVYMGLATVSYISSNLIVKALGISVNIVQLSLEGMTAAFLAVALMTSIYLPIFFKFGYIKARLFNLLIFLLFFFGPPLLVNVYNNPKYQNSILSFIEGLATWKDWQIAAILFGFSLLILAISYWISINIYKNREF